MTPDTATVETLRRALEEWLTFADDMELSTESHRARTRRILTEPAVQAVAQEIADLLRIKAQWSSWFDQLRVPCDKCGGSGFTVDGSYGSVCDCSGGYIGLYEPKEILERAERAESENARLKAAVVRRSGTASWEEWVSIWDPTEEAPIDVVMRLRQRAEKAEAERDAAVDRAWISGAMDGWNRAQLGDKEGLRRGIDQRLREIHSAALSAIDGKERP